MTDFQYLIFDEELTLSQALDKLSHDEVAQDQIIKELAKRIVLDKKLKEENIGEPDETKQNALLEQFRQVSNLTTDEAFQGFMEASGKSKERVIKGLVYQDKLMQLRDKVASLEDVAEAFARTKPMREQIMFSIIKVKEQELANKIMHKLDKQLWDFSELAKEYSEDSSAQNGGLIGPMMLASLNPQLAQVLISLRPGEITPPIENTEDNTYVIAQLNNIQRASLNSKLADSIRSELFEKWIEEQVVAAEPKLEELEKA